MSPLRGGPAAMLSRIAVLSLLLAAAPSPAGCADVQPAGSFTLKPGPLTETAMGRELLAYLVSCALPADVTVLLPGGSPDASLPGGVGLAPDWRDRPLTQTEQELVSACILARVNAFGVPVRLSLRAVPGKTAPAAGLNADREESRAYPLFEGAFFGNIFLNPPQKFVCTGQSGAEDLQGLKRICTLPAGGDRTVCDFVNTGPCPADAPPAGGGRSWPNAIAVFLAPQQKTIGDPEE